MSKSKKTETPELDIAGLLALKKFERPNEARVEKSIQNIVREVNTTGNYPSLLLFPDKSLAWMFAQPRYGIAALFVLFLGLHLLERPLPVNSIGAPTTIEAPSIGSALATVDTNQLKAVDFPGAVPSLYGSFAGEAAPLASFAK